MICMITQAQRIKVLDSVRSSLRKRLSIPCRSQGWFLFQQVFFWGATGLGADNGREIEVYYSATIMKYFRRSKRTPSLSCGTKELSVTPETEKFSLWWGPATHSGYAFVQEQADQRNSSSPLETAYLDSRKHLKAAPYSVLVYENELERGTFSSSEKEIAVKIVKILSILSSLSSKIEIAEYLHGISKVREPSSLNSNAGQSQNFNMMCHIVCWGRQGLCRKISYTA